VGGDYAGIRVFSGRKGGAVKVLGWDPVKGSGTFVGGDNPWGDLAKGEQLARNFLDQGADIVGPVAGATGNASIKAMAAADKWAIGVDTDQALSLPEYSAAILTSAEKRIDVAVLEVITKNAAGDLGGENFLGTLANSGVALSPFHDLDAQVPDELKAEIEALAADIASGAIKVADYLK
jgi:basic membrane protein A